MPEEPSKPEYNEPESENNWNIFGGILDIFGGMKVSACEPETEPIRASRKESGILDKRKIPTTFNPEQRASCKAAGLEMKVTPNEDGLGNVAGSDVVRSWEETKSLVKQYVREIQDNTGREISKVQRNMLKEALRKKEYTRLSSEEINLLRREYKSMKSRLISEWEIKTGQQWPTYTEKVVAPDTGRILRDVGDPYDAHHIIELSNGGDNKWWNIFPARFPDQHQGGIHAAGSASRELFRGGKK